MQMVLVSSCLMGEKVRYDGGTKSLLDPILAAWQAEGRLLWVCPEVAGGLGTPRPPAEIVGGTGESVLLGHAKVRTNTGEDVTAQFLRGAHAALALARSRGARIAILKARSPSCGNEQIYDGTHSRTVIAGEGTTAALLKREGVRVFHEGQLREAAEHLAQLEALDPRRTR
ncbi:MAG: DUF523 domain-containing protein [Planctomycetes bacterium]|jgi:uncharacterized protein YbbK (DUF523 family)|nr:DUF523 domain-containing protein [Planctomycetota bacterium]